MKNIISLLLFVLFALAVTMPVFATSRDLPPGFVIPPAARPSPDFDVERATAAYLDLLSPEQRHLSDAYFEGGYWLQLWGLLYGFGVAGVLLLSGIAQRLRSLAQRVTTRPWLATWIFGVGIVLAYFVLDLPWTIYTEFVRERQYGLATQDFVGWLGDALKSLLVSAIVVPPALVAVYAAVRRAGARWWLWASGLALVFGLIALMLAPVYVAPLFNTYRPLRAGPVREAVLSLARANGVPTDQLVEFDASRQTNRISANVAGFAGTTRIALNDNLLDKTSLPEIKAVLGHEMGHYVLHHGLRLTVYFTLVFALGFWLVARALDGILAHVGPRLGLGDRSDPASLPLAVAIFSLYLCVLTPLQNSIVRQAEAEADAFGLNAAREPHGFALVAMRLSTYRKIHPGPLEEIVFYDHPSGYTRVRAAMTWFKENQDNPTAQAWRGDGTLGASTVGCGARCASSTEPVSPVP